MKNIIKNLKEIKEKYHKDWKAMDIIKFNTNVSNIKIQQESDMQDFVKMLISRGLLKEGYNYMQMIKNFLEKKENE